MHEDLSHGNGDVIEGAFFFFFFGGRHLIRSCLLEPFIQGGSPEFTIIMIVIICYPSSFLLFPHGWLVCFTSRGIGRRRVTRQATNAGAYNSFFFLLCRSSRPIHDPAELHQVDQPCNFRTWASLDEVGQPARFCGEDPWGSHSHAWPHDPWTWQQGGFMGRRPGI